MAERDRRTGAEANEGFLRRWSRRKAEARSAPLETRAANLEDSAPPEETAPEFVQGAPEQDAPAPVDPEDLPEIESLSADSDFSVFMRPGVPAHLRTQALRKLWRSDPVFSHLDGLVEYGEDYTLPSWPKGTIKTAYQVGRGLVNELEKLAEREAEPAPTAAAPDARAEAVSPSDATTADPATAALADSPQSAPEAAPSKDGEPTMPPARRRTGAKAAPRGGGARRLPRRG